MFSVNCEPPCAAPRWFAYLVPHCYPKSLLLRAQVFRHRPLGEMSLYCGHLRSRFAHLYGLSGSIPVNVTITTLGWYHKNFSIGQIKCILLVQLQHWQWTYIFIDQIHVITLEIKNTILKEGLGFFSGPTLTADNIHLAMWTKIWGQIMGKCCSKNRDCLDQENRNQLQKKGKNT